MDARMLLPVVCVILLVSALIPGCTFSSPQGPGEVPVTPEYTPLPTPAGAPVAGCSGLQPAVVSDTNVYQVPSLAEPSPRVSFRDPVFGSCIVRVTDRKKDIPSDDSSKGLKNEYSRVQAFNADESGILIRGTEGTWYLYDAATLLPSGRVPVEMDPRWDATDKNLLYYISGTVLMMYSIKTGEQKIIHNFTRDFSGMKPAMVWTRYEGSPSLDGRFWGFMVQDENSATTALLIYDQKLDRIIAQRDLRGIKNSNPDSATISPLGTYLVVQDDYCERGKMGTFDVPCGLMVYDNTLKSARGLLRIVGHSDLSLDAAGREVLVFQDIDNDYISVLDLASGSVTPLYPIDFSYTPLGFHFSGLAFRHPGWAIVSTYSGGTPAAFTWMDDQVFAIELKKNGRIVRLAHTHSIVREGGEQDYWAEPQATVNRNMTKILFTSNWGRAGTDEVETYLIAISMD